MSKIGFLFHEILSAKYVKFILSSIVVLFILFNSLSTTFSFLCNRVDFNQVYSIQKDVISAIFVVSKVIDRVSTSFETKIQNQTNDKQNQAPAVPKNKDFNDVIIVGEYSNYKLSCLENCFSSFSNVNIINLTKINFVNNLNNKNIPVILVYFLMMLCFFTSVIKVYDINKIIKKYIRSPLF